MFESRARSLPKIEAIEKCRNWPYRKHLTRLVRLAEDKHSSLSITFVNYGHKRFYNIGPWSATLLGSSMVLISRGGGWYYHKTSYVERKIILKTVTTNKLE